jgi:hypothetical protein
MRLAGANVITPCEAPDLYAPQATSRSDPEHRGPQASLLPDVSTMSTPTGEVVTLPPPIGRTTAYEYGSVG